jgi:mRNA deadenylase 3'-5' endonuclease subunit Ccr4
MSGVELAAAASSNADDAGDNLPQPLIITTRNMPSSSSSEISLLSWNLLADCYARENARFYSHAVEATLWSNRKPRLIQAIADFNSDIVCLQEMMYSEFDDFCACLAPLGYRGVMLLKDSHSPGQLTSNATFYKDDKLLLVWEQDRSRILPLGFRLRLHQPDNADMAPAASCCDLQSYTPSQTANTTPPQTLDHIIYVANVHLEGKASGHQDRFFQLRSFFKHFERSKVFRQGLDGLVICGDHNNNLNGSLSCLLLDGIVKAGYIENSVEITPVDFSHSFQLSSAYSSQPEDPTFIMPPHSHYRLDHICYTPNSLRLKAVLQVLPDEDRDDILRFGLPQPKYPSDHMPIGCVFAFC